jgi:hypothetical protein
MVVTRYKASVLFRGRAFRLMKWFRHSLRIEPISRSGSVASFGTKQKSSEMTSFRETQAATSHRLLMNRFCRRAPLPLSHRTWPFRIMCMAS